MMKLLQNCESMEETLEKNQKTEAILKMLSNLKEEILQLKYDKKEIPENTKGLNLLERQKIIKKIKDKQEKLSQQEVIDVTDKEITDMLQTYKENMTKLLDIMKTLSIGDQEKIFIKQSMLKKTC